MKENHSSPRSTPVLDTVPENPVREADAEPTPKAAAKAANQLPRTEQLNKFEKDLEAHDSGNQPA